ncbi:MAG TPA: methionyl-tRNA formyltransferase [Bacteroidales bacterium]|nr:methionyl-tRNA formyltransferase [Bacteroidales bacterium]
MRIVFLGTPEFAVASLDALVKQGYNVVGVVTMPDKPANRGHRITYSAVKQYALDNNLRLLQPANLKDNAFLEELKSLEADLQIVVAFRMLPKVVYAMPKLGTFNLHGSLLPKYRGAAPIHWAVINGETQTGLTTFLLNDKIDEGEIIFQEKIDILEEETTGELHDRMMIEGGKLVVKTVKAIESGNFSTISQQKTFVEPSLAPKIFKETTLIPWDKKGKEIENFVRGMSPFPCATTVFYDKNSNFELFLKVYKVKFNPFSHKKNIGEIEINTRLGFRVYCLDGFVEILDLQQSGKKRMKVDEFLRGTRLEGNFMIKK